MRYNVIRQYNNNSELYCGTFEELNDAKVFIDKSTSIDNVMGINTVYWLFDYNQQIILYTSDNPRKLSCRYIENIELLPKEIIDPFNVIILSNGTETKIAAFANILDARKFVEAKLETANPTNESETYYLFDGDKFCEKIDNPTINSGSKGESKKVFRPTPLPTKPRLGPANYWVDEDEDKNRDKDK